MKKLQQVFIPSVYGQFDGSMESWFNGHQELGNIRVGDLRV
jgi:hypothetical protein